MNLEDVRRRTDTHKIIAKYTDISGEEAEKLSEEIKRNPEVFKNILGEASKLSDVSKVMLFGFLFDNMIAVYNGEDTLESLLSKNQSILKDNE